MAVCQAQRVKHGRGVKSGMAQWQVKEIYEVKDSEVLLSKG
jgi:hypothetical protein